MLLTINEMRFLPFVFLCYLFYNCVRASNTKDGLLNAGSTSITSRGLGPIGPINTGREQQELQLRYDQEYRLKELRLNLKDLRAKVDERAQKEAHILQNQKYMKLGEAVETCLQPSDRENEGFRWKCTYLNSNKREHHFRYPNMAELYCIKSFGKGYKCAIIPLAQPMVLEELCAEITPKQLLFTEIKEATLSKILSQHHPSVPHNQLNQPNLVIQNNQVPHNNHGDDYHLWSNNDNNIWSSNYSNQGINHHLWHDNNNINKINNNKNDQNAEFSNNQNKNNKIQEYRLF